MDQWIDGQNMKYKWTDGCIQTCINKGVVREDSTF